MAAVFVLGLAYLVYMRQVPNEQPMTQSETSQPVVENVAPVEALTTDFSLSEVATHNTKEDCWAAIKGEVYNLTAWIDEHPGGAREIISLCGQDGTAAFSNQHEGAIKVLNTLELFKIGLVK